MHTIRTTFCTVCAKYSILHKKNRFAHRKKPFCTRFTFV